MCASAHTSFYCAVKLALFCPATSKKSCWLRIVAKIRAVNQENYAKHSNVMALGYTRASDTGGNLEAFHFAKSVLIFYRAEGREIFEGISVAYPRVKKNHRRESARIYAIPKCPAIGSREQ
jgi:hypothetical protein